MAYANLTVEDIFNDSGGEEDFEGFTEEDIADIPLIYLRRYFEENSSDTESENEEDVEDGVGDQRCWDDNEHFISYF